MKPLHLSQTLALVFIALLALSSLCSAVSTKDPAKWLNKNNPFLHSGEGAAPESSSSKSKSESADDRYAALSSKFDTMGSKIMELYNKIAVLEAQRNSLQPAPGTNSPLASGNPLAKELSGKSVDAITILGSVDDSNKYSRPYQRLSTSEEMDISTKTLARAENLIHDSKSAIASYGTVRKQVADTLKALPEIE